MKQENQSQSSPPPIFLFVDTNFFLQLKVAKEIPWSGVSRNGSIILIVPRAVQKEIGRLKSDGNSRRSKRDRTASALLMRIAQSPGEAELVQPQGPEVQLRLAQRIPANPAANPELDANSTDDRIIGEVLSFQAAHPGNDVRFLTTDSDQVVSAKHFGITFLAVPADWHLPPESDERDKRIEEQRRRIAELEETEPRLEIGVYDRTEKPVQAVSLSVLQFRPLTAEMVSRLVGEATRRIPLAQGLDALVDAKRPDNMFERTLLATDPRSRFEAPTKDEVAKYREADYPDWLDRLRKYFEDLHEQLGLESRAAEIRVNLLNDSSRTAEGLIVTFQTIGGLLFGKIGDRSGNDPPPLPQPPTPPRGKVVRTRSSLDVILTPSPFSAPQPELWAASPHSPYVFYRREGGRDLPSDRYGFECDIFRHGGHEEPFELPFFLPRTAEVRDGIIGIEVFARNLSRALKMNVPVKVSSTPADTSEIAARILDAQLPEKPRIELTVEL